jgi:hypothetical protein
MKVNYRKATKLLTLLLSSTIIAVASAQVYRFMYIQGTVQISQTGLLWVKGDSANGYVTIVGSLASVTLSISNGTTASFTHYLYLKNLDNSTHSVTIEIIDPATSSLYETNGFNLIIYDNSTGTPIHTLNVLTNDSHSETINNYAVWHITFEVSTTPDATGNDSFEVKFSYT